MLCSSTVMVFGSSSVRRVFTMRRSLSISRSYMGSVWRMTFSPPPTRRTRCEPVDSTDGVELLRSTLFVGAGATLGSVTATVALFVPALVTDGTTESGVGLGPEATTPGNAGGVDAGLPEYFFVTPYVMPAVKTTSAAA